MPDVTPQVVIEGIEDIIKRDLEKHKGLLERSRDELFAYREARSHEIKRKKHYSKLIGGGKYNDESLRSSMDDIAVNIRHLSDKTKLAEDAIAHHTLIVDTLTARLAQQMSSLADLAEYRRQHGSRD